MQNIARDIADQLKIEATSLGFALCGITAAAQPPHFADFLTWLEAGYSGQMRYLNDRRDAYRHPQHVLDGCRTLVMLGFPYRSVEPLPVQSGLGQVARYAWNAQDYHDVIHAKLKQLKLWLIKQVPQASVRGVVDTAPLLEREFAAAAGLGWVGKNTLLLNRQFGSYFFLAALLTDLELELDPPFEKGFCGTCRACLEACPTKAFPRPFVLDASRCISYLTIEKKGVLSYAEGSEIGNWLFGCDVCQEVCPWNRKSAQTTDPSMQAVESLQQIDLIGLLGLDEQAFRKRFRGTALQRPKRVGILRNAAFVLGNQRCVEAEPALLKLLTDHEVVLRWAATVALINIGTLSGRSGIQEAATVELDPGLRSLMLQLLEWSPGAS